jgi:hypothetical protein
MARLKLGPGPGYFIAVFFQPLPDTSDFVGRHLALQDNAIQNGNLALMFREFGVEMRRSMVSDIHQDQDSINNGNCRHDSQIQQRPGRVFEVFLDADEERHSFLAVDDAVIVT